MASRRSRTRRTVAATAAAIATSGLVAASATTLGGITNDDLGADYDIVASCANNAGVDVSWGGINYQSGIPGYRANTVTVTVPNNTACNGQTLDVTVTNAADVSIGTGTIAMAASGPDSVGTVTVNANANAADNVAVVISE